MHAPLYAARAPVSGPVRVGSTDIGLSLEPIRGLRRLTWLVMSRERGVVMARVLVVEGNHKESPHAR
jgi:hypothetical protein